MPSCLVPVQACARLLVARAIHGVAWPRRHGGVHPHLAASVTFAFTFARSTFAHRWARRYASCDRPPPVAPHTHRLPGRRQQGSKSCRSLCRVPKERSSALGSCGLGTQWVKRIHIFTPQYLDINSPDLDVGRRPELKSDEFCYFFL